MKKITLFQKRCLKKLLDRIEECNISPLNCELVKGEEENYYRLDFDNCILWIYEDMADIKGKNKLNRILEPPDFDSEEELINEFIMITIDNLKCSNFPPE